MNEHTVRKLVKAYGVLLWLVAIAMLLGAIGVFDIIELSFFLHVDEVYLRILLTLGAFFLVILGIAIHHYKHWARIAALVISTIAIVGGSYLMIVCDEACTTFPASTPLNVLRILFGTFGIWFFTHEHAVVKLFVRK